MKLTFTMKNIFVLIVCMGLLASCGQGSDVEEKKAELAEAKKEYKSLKEKIKTLESELEAMDSSYAKQSDKSVQVATFKPVKEPFEHRIEVRGAVASRKNVLLSAETAGSIDRVHVKEGNRVRKGQVMISIDADILRNNIAELKTSLELATTTYERQQKLWDQHIGTEMQYLQAKNNKESLERKLATTQSQLAQATVRAPFDGVVDEVMAREGEMAMPGTQLVRITSPQDTYITADVSERYIGKLSEGDEVEVFFPVQDVWLKSTINSVGQVINQENRTFALEVKIPKTDFVLKPNQVAVLEVRDYFEEKAYAVPTRIIQSDTKGKYIYEIKDAEDKQVAKKLYVKTGLSYDGQTEIVEGIAGSETLVSEGFRDLSNDVEVAIAASRKAGKDMANK